MPRVAKEDLIVLVVFAILSLIPPAAIIARHFYEADPLAWLNIEWGRTVVGSVFLVLAALVSLFNFYVTIYAPWNYRRRHGDMRDFAGMSGLPVVGSLFVFCAGALLPPSLSMGMFLLFIYVIDGNGLPAFLVAVMRGGLG